MENQQEIRCEAARLLGLVTNPEQGIGTELFDAIIKIVPQPAVEALVVDDIDRPRKILVVWRADQNYVGWHFPGQFMRLNQDFETSLKAVVKREVGTGIKRYVHTPVRYSLVDGRGHTVGLVFLVEIDGEPKAGSWCSDIPEGILPHHKEFLKKTLGWE